MRNTIIAAVLLAAFPVAAALVASGAFAQEQVIFGKGASRIEVMKDRLQWEPEIRFRTPSFSGVIEPIPTLGLMSIRVDVGRGEYFDLRVPAQGTSEVAPRSELGDAAAELWARVKDELKPLARSVAGLPDFAPYARLFTMMSEGRGLLSYVRETDVFAVNRYRMEQAAGAPEVVELVLGGRSLRLVLPPEGDSFTVEFAVLPGNDARIEFVARPMGVYARVGTRGLPDTISQADVLKQLERLMEDALPALLIASNGNAKLRAVHALLAARLDMVRNTRFIRGGEPPASASAPERESGTVASAQPLPGYAVSLHRQPLHRLVYYYRTPRVNGLILLNRYPDGSNLVLTANHDYFNPDPADAEAVPIPDFTWELDYPRGVNEPRGAGCGHAGCACGGCGGGGGCACGSVKTIDYQALPEGDLALYYEAVRLFESALADDGFREAVPGELIPALHRFQEGMGTFRPDEAFKPLFALSYHEVQGQGSFARITYQDPEYYYLLTMPPHRGYLSFSFSYGEELAPLIYRFFLAPAGERTQLVVTYPVALPLGRAGLRFKRASAHLERLHNLAIYFTKLEPGLAELPAHIADIMAKRELVGPKVFMRPLPGPPYTEWLDAETLRGE